MPAGQTPPQASASGLQDKQAELVQSQQLDPLVATSSDAVSTDLASNSALQQPQSTPAQPGFDYLGVATSEQQPASDASSDRVVSPASTDVQVTTNVSDPPVQMTDISHGTEAASATATEARPAGAEGQRMPETPIPGLTAGAHRPFLVLHNHGAKHYFGRCLCQCVFVHVHASAWLPAGATNGVSAFTLLNFR